MAIFDFLSKKNKKTESNVEIIQGSNISINSNKYDIEVKSQYTNGESDIIPIDKRIKSLNINPEGLFPHEVLLLSYAPKYCLGFGDYPGFWWYKYGIKDVEKILLSLCDRNFLKLGEIRSAIENEKVVFLKEVLKKNNLKQNGNKDELVERLMREISTDTLNSIFKKISFVLTEKGIEAQNKNSHIAYIHHHPIEDLDIWSLDKRVYESQYRIPYRDVIWGYLNQRTLDHISNGNFGFYRNTKFQMSEFVLEEGRIETSFNLLCEVIKYDLSGLNNNFNLAYLGIIISGYFPFETSVLRLPPGIAGRVADYKEKMNFTEEQLKEKMFENMQIGKLPFSVFTLEECIEIVLLELRNDSKKLQEIYLVAEKRLKKEYKKYLKIEY